MGADETTRLAQLVFWAVIFVPAVIALALGILIMVKVVPIMLRQAQQLIDNNSKLTKIAEQTTAYFASSGVAISENTQQHIKQTAEIEKQTETIKAQAFDFKAYQSLVTDGLNNHGMMIEANTASIMALQKSLANLPAQIVNAIQDKLACDSILGEVQTLRIEVSKAMVQQQVKSTGTMQVVPPSATLPDKATP